MKRLILLFIGSILCSISLTIFIIYLTLFSYGFGVTYFFKSLLKNLEFYFFIPGIYLIIKYHN